MIAVVKTLMRPWCCERLIASLRLYEPDAHICVVDDSPEPHEYDCDTYLRLPFDSGLSAGRNAGLDYAEAHGFELALVLDDDLELTEPVPQAAMDALDAYDIVCGVFVEGRGIRHYEHHFQRDGDVLSLVPAGPGRVDIGHNLMLVKLPTIRWDPQFKIEAEHIDFFLTAQQHGLRTCHVPQFQADHHVDRADAAYQSLRFRHDGYSALVRKWKLRRIHDTDGRVWTR